mmetsp:Transcript_21830/g.53925  ORF Transcript_21830/g.53925 Transcript_21830/m.53925 type:complete len:211 (+) Transcript_21830:1252-1884(+)
MQRQSGPRRRSRTDSTQTASAWAAGSARRSRSSAWRRTASMSAGTLWPVLAEISTHWTSPPRGSTRRSRVSRSWRCTAGMSTPGMSVLVIATMIADLAASAWFAASMVCGMTPSSAATTKTTISVAVAPHSRIAVNASWPGVSKKEAQLMAVPSDACSSRPTRNAPRACVMPPNSFSATEVLRRKSSRVVLPWSTCPITVTTGARTGRDA